ncbi:hypothetical protein FHU23_000689 [Clostridium saccharobutylicum]|nr:hypothetical protein CLOSC_06150 [Clostridium saccharobutylicum]OAV41295.1 hypothetical protein M945_1250 [Clostridium saccharobutylicum DSM 13864]AQR98820.1 hypothetical protein CSACC_06220 [Clostridium saccharobutylicum]AQS12808.1 hypothetical protein CLOSACC_06220 [Clostridium saccharobutylicum]MBA2904080.1 hypothetical protein [Clostridium saccharobutylicum]
MGDYTSIKSNIEDIKEYMNKYKTLLYLDMIL